MSRYYVMPDRFEPGTFCVKNRRNEVVASGFSSVQEAEAWIAQRN